MEKLTIKQQEYLYRIFNNEKIYFKLKTYFLGYKPLNKLERKPLDYLVSQDFIIIQNNILIPNFKHIFIKKEYNKFIIKKYKDFSFQLVTIGYLKDMFFKKEKYAKGFSYLTEMELTRFYKKDDKYIALFHKNTVIGVLKYGYYLDEGYYKYKDKYVYEIIYLDIRKDYQNKGLVKLLLVALNKNIGNLNLITSTSFSVEGEKANVEKKIKRIIYNRYLTRQEIRENIKNGTIKKSVDK